MNFILPFSILIDNPNKLKDGCFITLDIVLCIEIVTQLEFNLLNNCKALLHVERKSRQLF